MSELMVLFQALLLVAGWLLFLKAQSELRAQSARQSLTGEMEALRQTIDALLNRLMEESERAEGKIQHQMEQALHTINKHTEELASLAVRLEQQIETVNITRQSEPANPSADHSKLQQTNPSEPPTQYPMETSAVENRYNLSEQEKPTLGVVAMLAEQGLTIQEIARQTGYAPGEVELILNLKRHLSEENR
ncbi:MAG: hypothetical protein SNJ72_03820 [Fimbriimonadales bacterium]